MSAVAGSAFRLVSSEAPERCPELEVDAFQSQAYLWATFWGGAAAHEHSHGPSFEHGILHTGHHGPVDQEGESRADRVDRQLVQRTAGTDRLGWRPGEQIHPAVLLSPPDPHFTTVAGLQNVEPTALLITGARPGPLVSHDQPVPATGRPADLAEGSGHDHVAEGLSTGRRDGDELARPPGEQTVRSVGQPC